MYTCNHICIIYHDSYFQRELIGWTFWKAHRLYPNQEWPLAENSLVSQLEFIYRLGCPTNH